MFDPRQCTEYAYIDPGNKILANHKPGFLIIFARLSDIFGRKLALLSALTLFTVFSLACGVAQTTDQLYVQIK